MAYSVEKISGNQVKITFTVPNAHFLEAVQKAYLKMRGRINIPGFRKGKAPRKLIENMYGESVFYEEALDVLFPDVYSEAVDGEHLQVVDRTEMDEVKEIGADKDLQFSVKVYVSPDIELGDYKGLKATRYAHEVTDEEVNARIDQDVRKATTTADVTDRALESGDTAKLDYAGTVDGVAFDGGTAKDQTLKIGSGTFIYLAALTGVDESLYEAAYLDGATRMQRIMYITLPMIKSTIVTMLILNVSRMMTIGIDAPLLLGNDAVILSSEVISTYVYRLGIIRTDYSQATAIGLFQNIVNIIILIAADRFAKAIGENGII